MRWLQVTFLGLALVGPARAEDIVDVLRRSQQQRLESQPAPTPPARAPSRCGAASRRWSRRSRACRRSTCT